MNCHLYSQTSRKLAQVATCFAESRLKGRGHRNASQIIHRVFPGPVRADLEDALAGVADELGGKVPDPVAERVQVGVPQVFAVVEAEEAGPGGQACGDAGGEDPAAINLRVPKPSRWQRRFRVLRFRSASFWKTATLAALRTACPLHARSDGKPQ
jgi:hypothetical protein